MNKLSSYAQASQQLTPIEKTGQLFMPAAFINDTEKEIVKLEKTIQEHCIGGLCFFHSRASAATNFEGKKTVTHNAESFETLKELIKRYQNVAKYPLLISIDAEWGLAMRIENTPQYPYAITLGAIQDNSDLIYEVGKNIAKDCKAAGVHWNLAPVVDINNNPENPVIGYRSFGEDRTAVANKALAYIQGAKSEGVLTSIKHFPGHGDTATDSHLGLPLIDKSKEELVQNELHPFQKLIDEGVDSVMVGHLSVPALANGKAVSSSISKKIIKGVLRKEMGFKGVVISDALNMHAVSKNHPVKGELEWLAFDAGNDVLCFAEHTEEGIEAILKNASEEQIEESFKRVWKLKEKAMNNIEKNFLKLSNAEELNRKTASASLTLLKGNESDIAGFRNTNYCTLTLKRFDQNQDRSEIKKGLELTKSEVENEKNILLLVTPPYVKPVNYFGFLKDEINFINELVQTKNVVLYLFGNPFMMNHINFERTTATVVVYQSFKVFQDIATEHFLGNILAKGKLPVRIKPWKKTKKNR
ncbi:beta-N-acetylglucosaminidase [hydrothermal vent metagenome]|uniref:beta-N-acetylhexosaminidase n=1 Tax=hydrothermal vent metagenome TaxID=652676 RepID=A0A3B0UFC3_9ZZZZ